MIMRIVKDTFFFLYRLSMNNNKRDLSRVISSSFNMQRWHMTSVLGATTSPFGPNSVSELWVIFQGSLLFLAVTGHSPITILSTLNFLVERSRLSKKRPRMTTDQVIFWPKMHFTQKKTKIP